MVALAWYHGHRALRRMSGAELTIITVLLVMASAVLWHFAHAPQEPAASKAVPPTRIDERGASLAARSNP